MSSSFMLVVHFPSWTKTVYHEVSETGSVITAFDDGSGFCGNFQLCKQRQLRVQKITYTRLVLSYLIPESIECEIFSTSSLHAQLEAILWDMDGVLADTERDGHRPAFNQAFQESNLDTEWDEDRYGILLETGGGKERMTAHWNEVGWPSKIAESDREQKVKELHLRKTDIFMEMIQTGSIPLRPGVLRLVDEAIAVDVKLAVCSTSAEKAVRNLVQTLMGPERAPKFQIFAGDMVKRKKPAPDVYNMAVDQMGLDKGKCVIIGR
jgi:beta-phosphoglucomutase-like phosphatase (HAD superfamily)